MPAEIGAKLLDPPESILIKWIDSTLEISFPVYADLETGKTLLKCDLCGSYLTIGATFTTKRMHNHRNSTSCQGHRRRFEARHRQYLEGLEKQKADATRAQVFEIGSRNALYSMIIHQNIPVQEMKYSIMLLPFQR